MLQSARGMQDSLPTVTPYWEHLETHLQSVAQRYGYQQIRFPIIEKTELFRRSIGAVTDIIEKEMYHLVGGTKDSGLSLRPEGTAGCVRAAIENQLLVKSTPQRLWYLGPMFRHERPQKGRYRQFHQFGVEAFGMEQPDIEVELIAMTQRLWQTLDIHTSVQLEINSLGNDATRAQYKTQLVKYFTQHFDMLDENSKRRLHTNPLRILDSKDPTMLAINQNAPILIDYLDEASAAHFARLQTLLQTLNISFTVNPRLVRGLDYYNRTVFEWVMKDAQGAQNTICAGGRYDGLVKQLGGPSKPAVGFAIGLERLLSLYQEKQDPSIQSQVPHLYVIKAGVLAATEGLVIAEKLRSLFPHFSIHVDCVGGHFSQQFKRANEKKALIALILGENEVNTQTVTLKHLQHNRPQVNMNWSELIAYLEKEQF